MGALLPPAEHQRLHVQLPRMRRQQRVAFAALACVVVDRAFQSLTAVAGMSFGKGAQRALRALGWGGANVPDLWSSAAPRIVMQDPHDQVIPFPASLASGLAEQGLGLRAGLPTSPELRYNR